MNLSKYIDKDISIKWFADNAINLFFGKRTIKVDYSAQVDQSFRLC